jgi:hypothetical protein
MSETELKVGDLIATTGQYGRGVRLNKIVRITPTTYVTQWLRFRKSDLRVIGGGTFSIPSKGRLPTEADFLAARIRNATEELKAYTVTADNIDAVETLLNTRPAIRAGD